MRSPEIELDWALDGSGTDPKVYNKFIGAVVRSTYSGTLGVISDIAHDRDGFRTIVVSMIDGREHKMCNIFGFFTIVSMQDAET